jgi:Mg-chelatase subunit ChlI
MGTHGRSGVAVRAVAALALVAAVTASPAQDVKRPDGTVILPSTAPAPAGRSGYDPNSTERVERDNARKTRAEENQRRLDAQRADQAPQLDQTQRQRDTSATRSSPEAIADQRNEQVEKSKRARDAAADTPLKRQ